MVAAVADHGYAKTTIGELVDLASVSRSAFYEHYESKEECFLATHDEIARIVTEHVMNAYRQPGDWRERLHAAFEAFVEIVIAEPDAAYLAVVETHAVGTSALERHELVLATFASMIRQSAAQAPGGTQVSETTIRAIVSGIRGLVFERLRGARVQELHEILNPVFDWALSYLAPEPLAPGKGALEWKASGQILGTTPARTGARARNGAGAVETTASRKHRERILKAVTSVASSEGYLGLSIPKISAAAGVSNQTFYEHFDGKLQAFLAAYEEFDLRTIAPTLAAYQAESDWPKAIAAAIAALLSFLASEPESCRLGFFAVPAAGRSAIDRANRHIKAYELLLAPGFGFAREPPAPIVANAIAGGFWGVIQREIIEGRTAALPELAHELTVVVLTPFIGADRLPQR